MSARNAIHQHSRRMLVRAMYSKLTVAAVALVAGIGLFWMWGQFGACKMTLCSSLVAIVVAVFWGLEYALLTGRLIVGKSGHINIELEGFLPSRRRAPHRPPTDDGRRAVRLPKAPAARRRSRSSRLPTRRSRIGSIQSNDSGHVDRQDPPG